MNFDLPITISMECRGRTPRRVSYELPRARGVHVFVTGHEPSHVVHAVQSFAWETELPESYDKEGSYTFTISQGEDEVSTSWDKGVYKGIKTSGISPMLRSIIEPSDVPEQWARDVEKAAYPAGASIPASLRRVLEQVLSWRVVALTYPEHGLYPRAVRALANGLKELNQIILDGDLPMLVLVETASAGFLDDLTRPHESGSLGDRIVFTTYDGLVSTRSISEHYLGMFSFGSDLYYREQEVVAGKRPDATLEERNAAWLANMRHSIRVAEIISQGQRTPPVPSQDGEAAIDFASRLFSIVEVEAGGEVTHVVVGRTVYEALRSSEILEEVDECRAPNPNARLWGTLVFLSLVIFDDEVIVAAYGPECVVARRGILTR